MFLAYGFKINDHPSHIEPDSAASSKAGRSMRARIARGLYALFSRTHRDDADFERFVEQHGPFGRYLP